MLGSIGMPELIVIFIIALIVFGPRKLPEVGRALGRSLAEFKKATSDFQSSLEEQIRLEEQRANAVPSESTAQASTSSAAQASTSTTAPHAEDGAPDTNTRRSA